MFTKVVDSFSPFCAMSKKRDVLSLAFLSPGIKTLPLLSEAQRCEQFLAYKYNMRRLARICVLYPRHVLYFQTDKSSLFKCLLFVLCCGIYMLSMCVCVCVCFDGAKKYINSVYITITHS